MTWLLRSIDQSCGEKYNEAVAFASNRDGANTAIYWEQTAEDLTANLLDTALDSVNSPLTDQLRKLRDDEIYSKAALHLIEIAAGTGRSLAGVAQAKAWRLIAALPRGATDRLLLRTGLTASTRSPISGEERPL